MPWRTLKNVQQVLVWRKEWETFVSEWVFLLIYWYFCWARGSFSKKSPDGQKGFIIEMKCEISDVANTMVMHIYVF